MPEKEKTGQMFTIFYDAPEPLTNEEYRVMKICLYGVMSKRLHQLHRVLVDEGYISKDGKETLMEKFNNPDATGVI